MRAPSIFPAALGGQHCRIKGDSQFSFSELKDAYERGESLAGQKLLYLIYFNSVTRVLAAGFCDTDIAFQSSEKTVCMTILLSKNHYPLEKNMQHRQLLPLISHFRDLQIS